MSGSSPDAWDLDAPVVSAGWDGSLRESLRGTNRVFALADQMMTTPEGRAAWEALEAECDRAGVDSGRCLAAAIGCTPYDPPPPWKDPGEGTRLEATERLRRALARAFRRRMYVVRAEESIHTVEDFTTTVWLCLRLLQDHVIGP